MNKTPNQSVAEPGKTFVAAIAVLFFVISTWVSYAHWANFECRTFDLANYVQGIWQLLHGRFAVSVIGVPLLGNHVEPIVFLFAPLFAVFRHPMLFVAVQNAALATMGPVGYSIARRLGLDGKSSALAASALLLAPAAGYVALHEFHPEALSAPFLLLMLHARLAKKLGKHWLWFIAVLACKENMALLLAAYCAVHCVAERKRGLAELRAWFLWPMTVAILWFVICAKIITPALNSGNVDYIALYDRLGASPVRHFAECNCASPANSERARPISHARKSGLGAAVSVSGFAAFTASLADRRRADSFTTLAIVAGIGVDDLFSLCRAIVALVLDRFR